MPCFTDICAARSPSDVQGYLMYAFGIHENISCPWLNISCADVFSSENTSIENPASLTNGKIVCTVFLYSSISSRLESLRPDAISSLMCGFLAINEGLVVCPSTNPSNSLARRVSCGSPPSTNIFVFGSSLGPPKTERSIFRTTPKREEADPSLRLPRQTRGAPSVLRSG